MPEDVPDDANVLWIELCNGRRSYVPEGVGVEPQPEVTCGNGLYVGRNAIIGERSSSRRDPQPIMITLPEEDGPMSSQVGSHMVAEVRGQGKLPRASVLHVPDIKPDQESFSLPLS